jgi:PAS domain S-box-containing protein
LKQILQELRESAISQVIKSEGKASMAKYDVLVGIEIGKIINDFRPDGLNAASFNQFNITQMLNKKASYIDFENRIKELESEIESLKQNKVDVNQAKELYLKIFEDFPALIWRSGLDKLCDYFNSTWLDFTGRTMEQELGTGWTEGVHPDDFDFCLKTYNTAFDKKEPFAMDYRLRNKDGEYRWIRDFGRPFYDIDNTFLGYIGSCYDITENKEKEDLLIRAKEKAEESDRLKTAFLQNLSHEIRTPLNSISGFAGLLNKPDLSKEKVKSFVSVIQENSDQLIAIVTDILTIASIETGQEKLYITKVSVNEMIIDLLAKYKKQSKSQNVALYAKRNLTDKASYIYTDKMKLEQILNNLLGNAFKFTQKGKIELGYLLNGDELEFYVKDSGIGIEPEQHIKIFERFRQADKPSNQNYEGTGLGLAISKAFVELLGGKIWLKSKVGSGSVFYFTIPYKPVTETSSASETFKAKQHIKTLLIAEDEEFNYLFIEELLHNLNYKLIHAKDGREAVEYCRENSEIDLILMDIKMPDVDGYQAAKEIKAFRPDLPIIAQSAYAMQHEIEKYGDIFDDYLTKPIDEELLIEKVNAFLK